ncbi:MAG: hypothetical protein O7A67_04570, partial [SAR324 cluster bacterium]|nr:hypothetical protein [SAR324 cluster bacterium]
MKNRPAPMNKNRSLARRVKALVEPQVILCRMLLSEVRMLPGFIVIGARKSGTTFLYRNMLSHPNILPAYKKEVHFFDLKFDRGIHWYRAHFPIRIHKYWVAGIRNGSVITGESTPYYLFHPRVP